MPNRNKGTDTRSTDANHKGKGQYSDYRITSSHSHDCYRYISVARGKDLLLVFAFIVILIPREESEMGVLQFRSGESSAKRVRVEY